MRASFALAAATLATRASSAGNDDARADVYFVTVGSSDYIQPPFGYRGFPRLDGMNRAARVLGDLLVREGARRGIVLTSALNHYVSKADVTSALQRIAVLLHADHSPRPLLLFYFAGHGVSEGVGWNHFSIPGNFVYRGDPKRLTVNDLSGATIHAATLVDAIQAIGAPYVVLLDTCYSGEPTLFNSSVLSGTAQTNLTDSANALRVLNEFRDPDPVLFSATPGSDAPVVPNPLDSESALSVGPLARRMMIILDGAGRRHSKMSLASFVDAMRDPKLDRLTLPAVTHAELNPRAGTIVAFDSSSELSNLETRTGTATNASVCCGKVGEFDPFPGPYLVSGTLSFEGSAGEFVSGGKRVRLSSSSATMRMTYDGVHGLTVTIDTGVPGDSYDFGILSGDGSPLHDGHYAGAQRQLFQDAGHPGLTMSVPDRGCNKIKGDFDVLNINYDSHGRVSELSAKFKQYCDGSGIPLSGSIDVKSNQ